MNTNKAGSYCTNNKKQPAVQNERTVSTPEAVPLATKQC